MPVYKSAVFKAVLSVLKSPFMPEREESNNSLHLPIRLIIDKINLHWLSHCVSRGSVVDCHQTHADNFLSPNSDSVRKRRRCSYTRTRTLCGHYCEFLLHLAECCFTHLNIKRSCIHRYKVTSCMSVHQSEFSNF